MFQSTRFKANSFSVQCSGDVFTTSEFTNSCVPSIYKEKFSSPILCFEKKRSDVARSSPGFYRHNLPSSHDKKSPFSISPATLSSDKSFQWTKMCDWDSRVLTGWVATCQLQLPPSVQSPVNGFPQFSGGGAIQRQLWPLVYP